MRQGGIGEEPEYRRQQKEAAQDRKETQQHEDVIGAISAIATGINRVAAEHSTNRHQADTHERAKAKRESITIAALISAAAAAIVTLIVSHSDNRAIIRGAEDTAKRQLRAYVFVDVVEMIDVTSVDGPKTLVRIKNAGQTPAYKLRNVSVYTNVGEYPPRTPLLTSGLMMRGRADTASVSELGPGSGHDKRRVRRPIDPFQIIGLVSGTLVAYLFGEVHYTDAFNCDRWIRYRSVLGGPAAGSFPQLV
jgi:hypothetical protein